MAPKIRRGCVGGSGFAAVGERQHHHRDEFAPWLMRNISPLPRLQRCSNAASRPSEIKSQRACSRKANTTLRRPLSDLDLNRAPWSNGLKAKTTHSRKLFHSRKVLC